MKCYCYETEDEFVLCVEDADEKSEEIIQHAWFKKTDNRFIKPYPKEVEDKELISRNFACFGQAMFEGASDWKNALSLFAQKCNENQIEWYIIGSISEAVLGVSIKPHDIDIIVHTNDFYRVKNIFPDALVEPFVDNTGTWIVRYFGRLCLAGVMIDIAADDKMNLGNHQYDKVSWNNYEIYIEPLQSRYQIELKRNREDRIKAIAVYLNNA
jgi:hypothetical protein